MMILRRLFIDGAIFRHIRMGVGACLSIGFTIVFVGAYVSVEHPAYIWDYSNFWDLYKDLAEAFAQNWLQGLIKLRWSIAADDYNHAAVALLMPVHWLWGGERAPFLTAVAVVFLTPAAIIAARLAQDEPTRKRPPDALALFAALSFTPFWAPTLRGYVDIASLIPLGLAALLLRKTEWLTQAQKKTAISLGLLLWCAFLFRRWYAFSIVALGLTTLFIVMMKNVQRRLPFWKISGDTFLNFGLAGSAALLAALVVQPHLMKRIFMTSYSDAYSGYQTDLATQIGLYQDHLGLWVLTFVAIGLIADIKAKRANSLTWACVAMLTVLLFSRVQAPGLHHILPVAFLLFPAYVAGLSFVATSLRSPRLTAMALCGVMSLNFVSSFAPMGWGLAEPLRMAFPTARHPPLHLAQYDEYRRLISDLKGLEPTAKVAVFASSFALSDSLLSVLDRSLTNRIEWVGHVDRRDGFTWATLAADYALVGAPAQLHLKPGSQRVIEFPAQDIIAGVGVGAAFVDTGRRYALDDGATALLFKRTRSVTAAEISHLANQFYAVYPDWRGRTQDVGFGLASAVTTRGERTGGAMRVNPDAILLRPGTTQPTSITFRLDEWFRPSKLKTTLLDLDFQPCATDAQMTFEFTVDDATTTRVVKGGEAVDTFAPTGQQLKITMHPAPQPHCELAKISFEFADASK